MDIPKLRYHKMVLALRIKEACVNRLRVLALALYTDAKNHESTLHAAPSFFRIHHNDRWYDAMITLKRHVEIKLKEVVIWDMMIPEAVKQIKKELL